MERISEFIKKTVEKAGLPLFIMDSSTGKLVYASSSLENLLGCTREGIDQLEGLETLLQKGDVAAEIKKALEEEQEWKGEVELASPGGQGQWVNLYLNTMEDPVEKTAYLSGICQDISQKKKLEGKLEKIKGEQESTSRITQIGNWKWLIAEKKVYWSREIFRFFGYAPGEKKPTLDLFSSHIHPEDKEMVQQAINQALEGKPYEIEHRFISTDGKEGWLYNRGEVVKKKGKPAVLYGTAQIITRRKQAEMSLQQIINEQKVLLSQQKKLQEKVRERDTVMEAVFNAAQNIAFIITDDHPKHPHILEFSPGAEQIFGYTKEELIGKKVEILHSPQDISYFPQAIEKLRNREIGFSGETALIRKSGEKFTALFTTYPLLDEHGRMWATLGVTVDITEQKKTEEELRQKEEQLQGILESQLDLIVRVDNRGRFSYVNEAYCKAFGKKKEELIGQSFTPLVHPEDIDDTMKAMENLYVPPYRAYMEQRAMTVEGWRWIAWEDYAIRNEQGEVVEIQGVGRDITRRKEAEEDLARHATEMELKNLELENARNSAQEASQAKSEFLASMSHEIRTPMNSILGMADLLAETPLSENQKKYVQTFRSAGENLLKLINDILDISKIEAGYLELVNSNFNLVNLVEKTTGLMSLRAEKKGLEISCYIHPEVNQHLYGDSDRLRQVLVNLLGNAIKFTQEGEVLLEIKELYPEKTTGIDGKKDTVTLLFSVKDTGIGISQDKQEAIFEGFTQADSSTTRIYGGTGLGLTISRRLVNLMGGELKVESTLGQGSNFYFTIPFKAARGNNAANTEESSQQEKKSLQSREIQEKARDKKNVWPEEPREEPQGPDNGSPGAVPSSSPETSPLHILLVEDNADNRLLVKAFLKKTSHQLDYAKDGQEALEKFKNNLYDLVLMDIQMPIMDGYTATREIRRWEKDNGREPVPIIALTAYALEEEVQKALDAGCSAHIAKPVKKNTLLENILHYGAHN